MPLDPIEWQKAYNAQRDAGLKQWASETAKKQADANALAEAEQIRKQVEFRTQMDAYQRSQTSPQSPSQPDQTVNIVLTTPSGQKQLIPTTQSGAAALLAALKDAKLTAGY